MSLECGQNVSAHDGRGNAQDLSTTVLGLLALLLDMHVCPKLQAIGTTPST
jgi:hypothetical protein